MYSLFKRSDMPRCKMGLLSNAREKFRWDALRMMFHAKDCRRRELNQDVDVLEFNVPLDTLQAISEMTFLANHLTGVKSRLPNQLLGCY